MIHHKEAQARREIYIIAFAESQIHKWDNSLRLHKQPFFVDPALESLMPNLAKTIEMRAQSAKSNLKETHQKYLKKISDTVMLLHQDNARHKEGAADKSTAQGGDQSP